MDIKSYEIEIDEKSVLRYLGYKDSQPYKGLLDKIRNAIHDAYALIEPVVCFDRVSFEYDNENDDIRFLRDDVINEKHIVERLKGAEYVIMAVVTIKDGIENASSRLFDDGKYMDGMIYDAIGNAALDKLCEKFYSDVADYASKEGYAVTEMMFPGDDKWDIASQKIIFKHLDASKIGVTLDENNMMHPVKSLSFILGIGKDIKSSSSHHDCSKCDFFQCIYRNEKKMYRTLKVKYRDEYKEILAQDGANIFKTLIENGVPVPNSCGGYHTCGKCKVIVSEHLSISGKERQYLSDIEIERGIRLSCFVNVDRDLSITVLDEGEISVLTESVGLFEVDSLNPRVKKIPIKLDTPTLDDQRDDFKRICDALGFDAKIPLSVLKVLPGVLDKSGYNAICVLRKNEIISIKGADFVGSLYGISLDIGTTTIAAYLYDIVTGKMIDVFQVQIHKGPMAPMSYRG